MLPKLLLRIIQDSILEYFLSKSFVKLEPPMKNEAMYSEQT